MDSLWGNIFKQETQQEGTRLLLKKIPVFEALDKRELEAVERILYRRSYEPDEVIFRQGDPGVGMYIIEAGTVGILAEPAQRVLSVLAEGEFFGEIALLNETPRSATARAQTPCTLLGIFQPDLLSLIQRNPRLGVKVLLALAQITGQRLIHADRRAQVLRQELDRVRTAHEPDPLHDDELQNTPLD